MLDQLDATQVMTPAISATSFSAVFSYTVGPIDQAQITTRQVQLSTGDTCTLLVPRVFPTALFDHPGFQQGYECGYLVVYTQEDEATVPKLLNDLYRSLEEAYRRKHEDPWLYPWTLGHILGDMAGVAEWDKTLALTGLAHVCFLLPFFTQADAIGRLRSRYPHNHAVKAYRARIRTYREQGKNFEEAQQLALC